jgi:ribosomal protein S12 methylthiotransferase accessory factor
MIGTLSPRLRRAVSQYTGIVGSLEECLHGAADPPLFQAACGLAAGEEILGAPLGHLFSVGGAGTTRAEAAGAAVGEALERYSATYVPRETLVVATARELGDAAVEPERLGLFSERQLAAPGFPFRRFTADTWVAWALGRELPAGRPAYVPAELVYLGRATVAGARPIGYSTSSGLACDERPDVATVKALLELLERDAFMLVWTNRLSLPLVSVDAGLPGLAAFEEAGLRFAAVDLSIVHRVPCVLGVVHAPAGVPGALGVGAAAAPTAGRAWWKALAEAFSVRAAGVRLALLDPDGCDRPVASFEDHIRRYADHRSAEAAAFLDGSTKRISLGAVAPLEGDGPAEQLAALCRRVEAAGARAYAVDVTAPDVAELGVSVVRVIAPGLIALDAPHSARFLGVRRLYEAAAALGLRAAPVGEAGLNPDPHPFP